MKSFIVLALCFAVAVAIPVDSSQGATILRYENDNIGLEGFRYAFETSDGKSAQEEGRLKNIGTENEAIEVRGGFSYVGDDGVTYSITYTADENGFNPVGSHIPVGPS